MLRGAFAAALTPLRDGGRALDEAVFEPYAAFLRDAGIDGILALGTTGESLLLSAAERRRVTELYVGAGPLPVLARLREAAPNLAGLKVSDSPWERFSPYLVEGLDVFVGPEALIGEGMAAGAVGAVSALASAFPERVVEAVRAGTSLAELRASIERFPRHAALKAIVAARGVPIREDVRAPLRGLTDEERRDVLTLVA